MPEGFGARLRAQRERQSIALRTIADQTKIKISLLEGLEAGDVSHWPGGIFRRAFVRAYAQAIGLDPDAVVREFLELYPDPGEIIATAFPIPATEEPVGAFARLRAAFGAVRPPRDREEQPSRFLDLRAAHVSSAAPGPDQEPQAAQPDREAQQSPGIETRADASTAPPCAAREPELEAKPGSQSTEEDVPGDPDLGAVADVCTALGCLDDPDELIPLLPQVAGALDAVGLILWLWDSDAAALRPILAHGYSANVLAQLPAVEKDADNVTASAFRLARLCSVNSTDSANGAIAVPLMVPHGCGGVLAIELRNGHERSESFRLAATILAAQLAAMIRPPGVVAAAGRKLA